MEAIVALRNEKGSYSQEFDAKPCLAIVALRNEKGSYSFKIKPSEKVQA